MHGIWTVNNRAKKWQKVVAALRMLAVVGGALMVAAARHASGGEEAAEKAVASANAILDPGLAVVLCLGGILFFWKRGRYRGSGLYGK